MRDAAQDHAPTSGARKVFIKTFGCQMNVYDSERMSEALVGEGYLETSNVGEADLVILNTCHIREKAAEKVYSDLGRIRQVKEERKKSGKETLVTVAGCVAQAEGVEIVRRAPVVDLVVGPQSYHRLPKLLDEIKSGARNLVETDFPEDEKFASLPKRTLPTLNKQIGNGALTNSRPHVATAFLTIQEGCDKFCSFCVVPYTRGGEYSRPVQQIEDELKRLIERGVREVTLLGQNVNAFHGIGPNGASYSLADLLYRLAKLPGIERLRYTTSHANDMTEDLIAAHRDEPKVMPYLHLPFQAGSDRILAAMNRKHTRQDYIACIKKLRAARPDIALSTDIIVGFPGETDNDFEDTMSVVHEVIFAQSYSFKYSARPGTPAAALPDQVPKDVKSERLLRLQEVLFAQQRAFNEGCVGKTLPVLVERKGRRNGELVGRSPYLQLVNVKADTVRVGGIHQVKILDAGGNSLTGMIDDA